MLTISVLNSIRKHARMRDKLSLLRTCSLLTRSTEKNESQEWTANQLTGWCLHDIGRAENRQEHDQTTLQQGLFSRPYEDADRIWGCTVNHVGSKNRNSSISQSVSACLTSGRNSLSQLTFQQRAPRQIVDGANVHRFHLARQFSSRPEPADRTQNADTEDARLSGIIETAKPRNPALPWFLRALPDSFLPYAYLMRLDKPIGTWLLAWPCFWSIAMAAPSGSLPDLRMLGLFGMGALLLRGAGCTVNDLWDRDLDAKVERTRGRPLASGALTPRQGLGLLGVQLLLGLGILVQLKSYSIALGASSLALVFTYPLMKRITFWPQAYLGATFNWGALLGYAAIQGSCHWPVVLPLYLGGICWTLVYDTIYAHQDKTDDVTAGVKSTALLFGEQTRPWLSGFAVSASSFWALSGYMMGSGLPYYIGVAAAGSHMLWQVHSTDYNSRSDCMDKFVSNKWLGGLLFSGIVVDKLFLT